VPGSKKMLNLLITFKSGKQQVLEKVDYERIREQLDTKSRKGVIVDVEILPDDLTGIRSV